jgi:hypothetical protein
MCLQVESIIDSQEAFENGYSTKKMGIINTEKISDNYAASLSVDHEKLIMYSNL